MPSPGRIIGWEEGNVSRYCVSIDIMLPIGGKLNKKDKLLNQLLAILGQQFVSFWKVYVIKRWLLTAAGSCLFFPMVSSLNLTDTVPDIQER